VRPFVLLLAVLACRPAAPPKAEPAEPTTEKKPDGPASLLAGFDGPADIDPVADEAQRLAEGPLAEAAAREAPDMQLAGDLIAGKLAPGVFVEQEIRLEPGRCYALIAVGGDGITELDAEITRMNPVRGKGDSLAADAATGTTAVIGGGGNCYQFDGKAPTAARFTLRARAGQGVAVGQLYAR
jgi:hypothetical protein